MTRKVITAIFSFVIIAAFVIIYSDYNRKNNYNDKIESLNFIDSKVIAKGLEEVSKHKVIFAGITRDNAEDLPKMLDFMEDFGSKFKDYRVVIFENDSKDNSVEILKKYERRNSKIKIISENFNLQKRPSIKFLADIRNKYLDEINSSSSYDDFDILIFVDLDMKYGFDLRGILHSFSKIESWDMVCSNGIFTKSGKMWDAFAFRNDEFPYGLDKLSHEVYWSDIVPKIQKIYDPKSDLLPVYSCFGGIGIYKKKFIEGCRYDSIKGDCEHIPFHKCMREKNGARIFMNPAQLIRYRHYSMFE
jgi:hypothetical protein